MRRRGFTVLQRRIVARALRAPLEEWLRALDSGERVTFASLHARGVLERRVRRQGRSSADNAYEYRASAELREAARLAATGLTILSTFGVAGDLSAPRKTP